MKVKVGAALKEVVALIESTGVHAAADARSLDLPGALVAPDKVEVDRLGDDFTVTWTVYLIAGDHGPVEALDDLGDMFDQVKDVLGVSEAEPMSLSLVNHSANDLPAFRMTFQTNVEL